MTTDESKIVRAMKKVGTYKAEYMPTVTRLAAMRAQYAEHLAEIWQLRQESPELLEGFKKPVIFGVVEALRRDILMYERELGLTPAALKKVDAATPAASTSKLAAALEALG